VHSWDGGSTDAVELVPLSGRCPPNCHQCHDRAGGFPFVLGTQRTPPHRETSAGDRKIPPPYHGTFPAYPENLPGRPPTSHRCPPKLRRDRRAIRWSLPEVHGFPPTVRRDQWIIGRALPDPHRNLPRVGGHQRTVGRDQWNLRWPRKHPENDRFPGFQPPGGVCWRFLTTSPLQASEPTSPATPPPSGLPY
jgi:hypothetical protein